MIVPSYTLTDIRQHPAFPFADWRTDDLQFLMLELYWAERVRAVLGNDIAGYVPLFDTERDGNPILNVVHRDSLRGLRLIVREKEEGKPVYPDAVGLGVAYPLQPFMNKGRLEDGETPVNQLVLSVLLDERVSDHVDTFIRRHCIECASVDEMEALIRRYEDHVGMPGLDEMFPNL